MATSCPLKATCRKAVNSMARGKVCFLLLVSLLLPGCDSLPDLQALLPQTNLLGNDMQEAQAAARDGEWARAQRYLERYLRSEEDPDQRWVAWELLMEVARRSDPAGKWTVDYLETILLEYQDDPERARAALLRLAGIHEGSRQADGAIAALEQYSLLEGVEDEENAAVHRRLAKLYIRGNRLDAADDSLRICLALSTSVDRQAECRFDMANIAFLRDDAEAAAELATQVLNLNGDGEHLKELKARAGFLLADILEERGKTADALRLFKEIRGDYPNEMVVDYRIEALGKRK